MPQCTLLTRNGDYSVAIPLAELVPLLVAVCAPMRHDGHRDVGLAALRMVARCDVVGCTIQGR